MTEHRRTLFEVASLDARRMDPEEELSAAIEDVDLVTRQLQGWRYSDRFHEWELYRGGKRVGRVRRQTWWLSGDMGEKVAVWRPIACDAFSFVRGEHTRSLSEAMNWVEEKLAETVEAAL